ncbi:AsmA family protein, partial [Hansschlegelia beijingensis]
MNNTLTGLGLALVLALLAALIGPWFINWSVYRDEFAAQASALVGAPVTVSGAVDARLLPSPYVRFRDLTAGRGPGRLAVAEVEIEFAIAPLLRGEFRAERVKIVRPRLEIAVRPDGAVEAPFSVAQGSARAERISFDRAEIIDGAVSVKGASGDFLLDRLNGVAEAGSLKGPYRFEGEGSAFGRSAGLRLSTGRADAADQLSWYDNEWGFSSRMSDTAVAMA